MVLAANGPVFSAGHDFGDMAGADLERGPPTVRGVHRDDGRRPGDPAAGRAPRCTRSPPRPAASSWPRCDLAVAAESAGFAIPGGKGGLFCHTPLVAVARNVGRKRALEMALTGDPIDAATAADWGLINRVVPDDRARRRGRRPGRAGRHAGSVLSKALGKQAFYAQIDLDQPRPTPTPSR